MADRQSKGFTLIEILVVIAVISVIMAITVPAYLHSRQKADQVKCVSNLKQLGMAILAYSQDFDGYLPPYINKLPEDYPDWEESRELGQNPGYPDCCLLHDSLDTYVKNKGVWFCPNDPYAEAEVYHWRVRHSYSSYAFGFTYNPPLSSVSNWRIPSGTVPPSQLDIVRDANIWVGMPIKATFPDQRGRGCEHFKGTNELYLDGHVKWRKSSWSPLPE